MAPVTVRPDSGDGRPRPWFRLVDDDHVVWEGPDYRRLKAYIARRNTIIRLLEALLSVQNNVQQ